MKIIFMGTTEFGSIILDKLINLGKHEIVSVFTVSNKKQGRYLKQIQSPVHKTANKFNLPVFTPNTLKSKSILDFISSIEADLIVVAAYGLIIPNNILSVKRYGCFNVHPSDLPKYRGPSPLQYSILNNDKEIGVSIILMDDGIDTGDILCKDFLLLDEKDTFLSLEVKSANIASNLLINLLDKKKFEKYKQSTYGISYTKKFSKLDGKIDWYNSGYKIYCCFKAFLHWPGSWFIFKNEFIKILDAQFIDTKHNFIPGTILNNFIDIACGEGILRVIKLQRSGKKILYSTDFMNSGFMNPGDIII